MILFFFQFSHGASFWLPFQEGFSIKWRNILKTCLNSENNNNNNKTSLKNATNLKSESKYSEKKFKNIYIFPSSRFGIFFQKNRNIYDIILIPFYFYFSNIGEISHP